MKVTADAAAAVIAGPHSPPVEEGAGPAEPPEDIGAAAVVKDVEGDTEEMTGSVPQEPVPGDAPHGLFAPGACTEMAGEAIQAGGPAPLPDPQPIPKELSLREVAASEQMTEAAKKHGIMWARVKGFPYWPAQVMRGKAAEIRMDGVHRPSPTSLPVMFFGTLEIAWISPSEISNWQDGIKAKLHTKPKGRKAFDNALQQAADFALSRKWPQNWWSRKPPQPKTPGDPANAADRKRDADLVTSSDGAKRPPKAAKKLEAADSGELRELLGAEDIASAPKRKGAAGRRPEPEPKPPPYQQLRCNLWVCRARPKRMPKDEIPVCNCQPEVVQSPLKPRPSSAGPPLSPTKRQSVIALAADLACNRLLQPDSTPAAALPALPLPQIASCGATELAATAGHVPQPDVATDLAKPAPDTDGAQLLADEQLLPDEQLLGPAEPSSPPRASAALPLMHSPPTQGSGFTVAPAAPEPEVALPVMPAAPVPAQSSALALRTGCGENCLNRLSYIHCDPRLCPCGLKCGNRPFSMLQLPKMDLFLTENRGWGVRAAAPVPRGTFIVEYAGEVVDNAESKRRMAEAKASGDHNFYMMEMGPGLIIDARTKGTLARFINSSCAPNCEAQKWHDAATGEIRVGIFTAQDIEPGVELTYDYMFQHAGTAALAGAYRCMCGAPNCRGTMDSQPERFKDFGKRLDVFWDGDSVFYRGTVTAYSTTTRNHTILYDDNDVERVNLEAVKHRWLDESAPMKLSPLREALEAGKTLLGEEMPSLDLEAGPQPDLPAIIPPPPDTPEAASHYDAALPDQEAVPDLDTAMPDVHPGEAGAAADDSVESGQDNAVATTVLQEAKADLALTPSLAAEGLQAAMEPAEAGTEVPALASNTLRRGSVRGRSRGRGGGAKGRSAGKGKKRKAERDLNIELAHAPGRLKSETPALLEEEQEVQMPKHKMWLKRCQRESQEQDSPPCPDPLPTAHTRPPADPSISAHSGSQPMAELPAAGLEASAQPALFTHVSTCASVEPIASGVELGVQPAQHPHSTQIPRQSVAHPLLSGVGAPAVPAQFTHISPQCAAQFPAASLGAPVQPAQSPQVFHPAPSQLLHASRDIPAHPAQFTHLSALPASRMEGMPQPAQLAPELLPKEPPANDADQQCARELVPHLPVQPEQPVLRVGRSPQTMQSMQQYLQPLSEQLHSSSACGMPPPQPAADVSGASSAGELHGSAPFQQQLQASRKQMQGFGQQLHAVLGSLGTGPSEQPRSIWPEPDQALQPGGLPSVQAAEIELTPDRMLQPWQSLSAKPAVDQAQPTGSSLRHDRGSMADRGAPGFQHTRQGQPLHQGAPLLGTLRSGLGSEIAPGALPAPQAAPLLPHNFLQDSAGMHAAMYNMLLLQNPHLRAQLPPLPSHLGGIPSLPPSAAQWTVPQVPSALPHNAPAALQLRPPNQSPRPSSQVLPQWPKLDINLASGLQPSAPSQQPASFLQGMHAPGMTSSPAPGPLPALASLQAALEAQGAMTAMPPSDSLPGIALPRPGGAEPQQAERKCLGSAATVQRSPAVLADPEEPAVASETLPASEQPGAADMQTSSEVPAMGVLPPDSMSTPQHPPNMAGAAEATADKAEPSQSAGQACRPEDASQAQGTAAQTEKADTPVEALRETGAQSSLAARVSASILTGSASSVPPVTQAAAPACHTIDSRDHVEASAPVASGLVGSHASLALGTGPAHGDVSRPVGQAEASKLLGIRDDLDQLGPGQADVPCCGRKGSHVGPPAGVPEQARSEQASLVDSTDIGSAQQQSADQAATDLPSVDQAAQPSNQETPEGGNTQHAAGQSPQHCLSHVAPTEVSMHAASPERSSEAIPTGSSAVVSEPVVGHCSTGPDQAIRAAQPAASRGTSQDIPTAEHPTGTLPPPVLLEAGQDCGHMQEPITPRLFDPTALLGKAQSPALISSTEQSSPPRTVPAGPSAAVLPGPTGADAELWSFLVDSPSPVPKAKHLAWTAQQPPCFLKQNGASHAPGE